MQDIDQREQPGALAGDNQILDLLARGPLRLVVALIVPVIGFVIMWRGFIFMRDTEANKIAIAVVALAFGIFGVWFLYIATNYLVESLNVKLRDMLRPYVFVGPALVILTVYLVYPALDTIRRSFMDADSKEIIGFDHFERILTESEFQNILLNNLLWIIFVTGGAVSAGLLIAVLVDRIGNWEPLAKALIFLPMAISSVGASVIWKFMYDNQSSPNLPQIGTVNAVWSDILGFGGVDFVRENPLNNFAFMFIMFWMITGFCMVILSAAIKGVPNELLEAGRIDGANEFQIFFRIIVPAIGPTILTVSTTVLIMVLKVFDIVYVFGGQLFDADVVANRMFRELFTNANFGLGSALATLLLIAVLPLIFWNLYQLRQQRS